MPDQSQGAARRIIAVAASVASLLTLCTLMPVNNAHAASSAEQPTVPNPIVSYDFTHDDGTGKVQNSISSSSFGPAQIMLGQDAQAQPKSGSYADNALTMDGNTWVKLPDNILQGQKSATVAAVVKTDEFSISNPQWTYFFTLGGHRAQLEGSWAGSTHQSLFTSITSKGNGDGETYFNSPENLPTDRFATVIFTIDGSAKVGSIYINGRLVASSPVGATPDMFTAHNWNVIGESTYPGPGDGLFHGQLQSFSVYNSALTDQQIVSMLSPEAVADLLSHEADALVAPSTASADFALKAATAHASVQWTSSNEQVLSVNTQGAASVHPTSQDTVVTLTATLSPNTGITGPPEAITRTFNVTVPRQLSDQERVDADAQEINIANADTMRSNFAVPVTGSHATTISWSLLSGEQYATIDTKDTTTLSGAIRTIHVKRPAAGSQPVQLTLEATIQAGSAHTTRKFTVTVQPIAASSSDNEAYIWVYFTGEDGESQKVSIAASQGNNALAWNNLNTDANGHAQPILVSQFGEQGLRDPFIMRSHDGDTYYLLATDLKVINGDFGSAQNKGSKYIEIWESTDLVNWSKQRHVKVSSDYAGNTWAPEAYWDDALGKYVVYWASNLYDTTDVNDRTSLTYNRMMMATTDDFVTFSEPKTWIDVDRRGQAGAGSIDVTVQKVGDTYYRVYKDERSMTLREERSTSLTDAIGGEGVTEYSTALAGSSWQEVATRIGNGQPNGYGKTFEAGEGPSLFPANKGDVNGYQYYLFADQPDYHNGPNHYVPMATTDITKADGWTVIGDKMPESQMPLNSDGGRPRHGTVLGVTRAQYQQVLEAYEPAIAVRNVDAMDVQTAVGVVPQLPETAHLTFVDGHSADVAVQWDAIEPHDVATAGQFTVHGIAQDASRMPVEATVSVGQSMQVEHIDGEHIQVGTRGARVVAPPEQVQALLDAVQQDSAADKVNITVQRSPEVGSVRITSDGVLYESGDAQPADTSFVIRYSTAKQIIDVTYTVSIVQNLADTTHQRATSHDPSIVKDGDTYYIFGSHRSWQKSKDLVHWEAFSNNLSTDYATVLGDAWASWPGRNTNNNPNIDGNMWAPDVVYNKTLGKWCMYLSLNGGGFPYQQSMIVLLTADSPEGDWSYVGPVVYSGFSKDNVQDTDVPQVLGDAQSHDAATLARYADLSKSGINAIDSDINVDADGSMWMSYGSWFGGIYMLKLDPATGLRDYGTTYSTQADSSDAYYGRKIAGGYWNSGEGASYAKVGDWWYLFISYGNLGADGGYQIREFRSKALTGPYVDQNGSPAIWTQQENNNTNGDNKYVNRGLRVLSSIVQPGSAEVRTAQGGNSVLVDSDGAIYNVYHTRFVNRTAGKPNARVATLAAAADNADSASTYGAVSDTTPTATGVDHEVRVQQMMVSPDGWLVSTPYEYSGDFVPSTALNPSALAGTWNISVMDPTHAYAGGGLADPNIYHSVPVTLAADGTVSGNAQGRWILRDGAVELTITSSAPGALLSGVYTLAYAAQPNETGGYALVLTGEGGNVFTDGGDDIAQPVEGRAAIWAVRTVLKSNVVLSATTQPGTGEPQPNESNHSDSSNSGSNQSNATPSNTPKSEHSADGQHDSELATTGSAVYALACAAVLMLVLAGALAMSSYRKQRSISA